MNTLDSYFTSKTSKKDDKYGFQLYLERLFDERLYLSNSPTPTQSVEPESDLAIALNESKLILLNFYLILPVFKLIKY